MNKDSEIVYHGSYMEIEFPEIRKHRFLLKIFLGDFIVVK